MVSGGGGANCNPVRTPGLPGLQCVSALASAVARARCRSTSKRIHPKQRGDGEFSGDGLLATNRSKQGVERADFVRGGHPTTPSFSPLRGGKMCCGSVGSFCRY